MDLLQELSVELVTEIISNFTLNNEVDTSIINSIITSAEIVLSRHFVQRKIDTFDTYIVKKADISEEYSCPICMDEFKLRQKVLITDCGHHFHSKCLKKWFKVNQSCPMCRQ